MVDVNGIQGFLIDGDIDYLFRKASELPTHGVIVEIGSFMGLSSVVMAKGLKDSQNLGARIFCVDTWEGSPEHQDLDPIKNKQLYDIFLTNITNAGALPFVTPIRKASLAAAVDFSAQSIDLLFIDGDHSFEGCLADLEAWYPKLRANGILIGHDCVPDGGVHRAVERFVSKQGFSYRVLEPPAAHYIFEITAPHDKTQASAVDPAHAQDERVRDTSEIPTTGVRQKDDIRSSSSVNIFTRAAGPSTLGSAGISDFQRFRVALIYDNTLRTDTTGEHCKRALRGLCRVTHFLPSQLRDIPTGYDLYLRIDDGLQYDLPSQLHPTAWWAIDTHLSYERYLKHARAFDYLFVAQKNGVERLRSDGISAFWLPLACDPDLHRRHDVVKSLDFAFIGNVFPGERQNLLERLAMELPNHFIGQRYGDEMAILFSKARLLFNRSILDDVNMRVFEAIGCGSLLLTNDLTNNGQAELLVDGEHMVTYSDTDDLVKKAHYYLRNEQERERIAAKGAAHVHQHHTYGQRMQEILRTCLNGANASVRSKAETAYYQWTRPDIQALVPASARRILDVGCASGALGKALKARQRCEVTGIEAVAQQAEIARTVLDRILIGDAVQMALALPTAYFDCIILADVLEHLIDPSLALSTLRANLAPDGQFVISIPNVRHWSVVRNLLEGRWDYEEAGILDKTHLRFFTKRSFEGLLQQAGLRPILMGTTRVDFPAIPKPVIDTLQGAGLDVASLPLESDVYQYLYVAKPMTSPAHLPLTSIIILTYNQLEHTRLCLDSIERHTPEPHEIILVDNGSTDGTLESLRDFMVSRGNVQVISNSRNRGFAEGNNLGLALAKGEYILLLNNDTIVTEGWLPRMQEVFRRHPETGLVGPVSNYVSGPQLVRGVSYETLEDMTAFAAKRAVDHFHQTMETTRLVGFCLLIRREVVERIGGLDGRFGSGNFEDDDFCLRAALAGYKARIAQDVFIHHTGSQTFKGEGIDYSQSLSRNWELFKEKWRIPADTQYGESFNVSPEVGEGAKVVIRLPDLNVGHQVDPLNRRWWHENGKITKQPGGQAQTDEPDNQEKSIRLSVSRDEKGSDMSQFGETGMPPAYQQGGGHGLTFQGLTSRGEEAFKKGRLQEAEDCFKRALQDAPFDAKIHNNLSVVLWEKGNVEEALNRLSQALELDPEDQDVIINCAKTFSKLGKKEDARDIIEAYLEKKPWDYEVRRELDNLDAFPAQAPVDPKSDICDLLNEQGEEQFSRGHIGRAKACFEIALEHNPNNAKAHSNLGVIYWEEGNQQLTLEHFFRALELNPDDTDILINSAKALASVGELETARDYLRLYLQKNPRDEEAWKDYTNLAQSMTTPSWTPDGVPTEVADIYLRMGKELGAAGDLMGAGEALSRCLQLKTQQAAPYHELGRMHLAAGQTTEAMAMLHEALRAEPTHKDSVLSLGEIMISQGLKGEARAAYERYLAQVEDGEVREALLRL